MVPVRSSVPLPRTASPREEPIALPSNGNVSLPVSSPKIAAGGKVAALLTAYRLATTASRRAPSRPTASVPPLTPRTGCPAMRRAMAASIMPASDRHAAREAAVIRGKDQFPRTVLGQRAAAAKRSAEGRDETVAADRKEKPVGNEKSPEPCRPPNVAERRARRNSTCPARWCRTCCLAGPNSLPSMSVSLDGVECRYAGEGIVPAGERQRAAAAAARVDGGQSALSTDDAGDRDGMSISNR